MNAQRKLYYAKSGLSNGKQPTVGEHIDLVASYAAQFGDPLNMRSKAELAGLFHDFGKYSEAFQKVLRGDKYGVDHAICDASFLYRKAMEYDQTIEKAGYDQIIEAINGHHDGLRYINDINVHLKNNITQDKNVSINNGKESALHGSQYKEAEAAFLTDHPNYHLPRFKDRIVDDLLYMLSTRMLFSCLVDADYSVSAFEEDESYFTKSTDNSFDAERYLGALYAYRAAIQSQSTSDPELNAIRDKLFDACGACGESSAEGLFTLTAPTGTGKTLALLHFALKHWSTTGKKRIILVLPFLTLAEQNTETYQAIIPNLLVDHSGRELDDDEREFASRWTSPFIITTSVKFFESLFSHKPSECRKLHHIANSVVLFDEAQSIPPTVTSATLQTVNALCERYHTTMVFSTATQPSFAELRTIQWNPKEIMPEYRELWQHRINQDKVALPKKKLKKGEITLIQSSQRRTESDRRP